ncbi:Uncharacterised protein [Mycobacteroides abscessus subsp. abscessus]|nr:Uncharacterised protein [Mycobacteroides abscessus subsp. abscessus]
MYRTTVGLGIALLTAALATAGPGWADPASCAVYHESVLDRQTFISEHSAANDSTARAHDRDEFADGLVAYRDVYFKLAGLFRGMANRMTDPRVRSLADNVSSAASDYGDAVNVRLASDLEKPASASIHNQLQSGFDRLESTWAALDGVCR